MPATPFRAIERRVKQRLSAPGKGAVYVLPPVERPETLEWRELLELAVPHTSDSRLREFGRVADPFSGTNEPIVLMTFGFGTNVGLEEPCAWAASYGLTPADPYTVLALAEQMPVLRPALKMYEEQPLVVVAPIRYRYEGSGEVFTVQWGTPLRPGWRASLTSYGFNSCRYFGYGLALFAFRAPAE